VILHPVLTGTNDRDIELNLARSSGALFQSYIIDINGLGTGGVGKSCLIDPSGRVLHQAGENDEYLVTELDFDLVRRQRTVGLRNLGQPLKSFRDSEINFTVYNNELRENAYLDSLGIMQKPSRVGKTLMSPIPSNVLSIPSKLIQESNNQVSIDFGDELLVEGDKKLNDVLIEPDTLITEPSKFKPIDSHVESDIVNEKQIANQAIEPLHLSDKS